MSSEDSARLIAFVAQSPRLCAAHDRAGWCKLFAVDGQINDPVGSGPHEGRQAIEKFYDTFIAPNALSFDVEKDLVKDMTVVRDLHINTVMSTGVRISVPMHIRYVLCEEDGQLRIHRLYAHWELKAMLKQQYATLKGVWTSFLLTPRLLKYQGISGLMGFMKGMDGVHEAGKQTALAQIASDSQFKGWTPHKTLAAGKWVSVTVKRGAERGVAVFCFDNGPAAVSETQFFR